MKYLTTEASIILEKKLFIVMRFYRIQKYQKHKLAEKSKNKAEFLNLKAKELSNQIQAINEDVFKPLELKQALINTAKTEAESAIISYDTELDKIVKIDETIQRIFVVLTTLCTLRIKKYLDESGINVLNSESAFFNELLSHLTDTSNEGFQSSEDLTEITDTKIEEIFTEHAKQKISASSCKKGLIQAINSIGIFASPEQAIYPSDYIISHVNNSFKHHEKLTFITRVYGLRDKVKELKLKRDECEKEKLSIEEFDKCYSYENR